MTNQDNSGGWRMKQKFFRGQRVKVADEMPPQMSHFPAGFEAIIVGSYADQYHTDEEGRNFTQFTLGKIKGGKVVDNISWYDEYQLTLVSDDRREGERLLQEYNESRSPPMTFERLS